jgi:cyclic pyranopterin phosphate synthase
LDEDVFKKMNGRGFAPHRVLHGIERAAAVGLSPVKINAVVQKGINDHTVVELARYFKGTGHIVRFIEYMDVGNRNGWKWDQVVPAAEIIRRIDAEMPLEPLESDYRGEVAVRYKYRDGEGEIGVIASVTQPFCGDCTRSRLSTDGLLFTCLFASRGVSLREPIRAGASDHELTDLITRVWGARVDRYSEERTELAALQNASRKVEMYQIGG